MKLIKKLIIQVCYRFYNKYFYTKQLRNPLIKKIIQNEFHKLYYFDELKTWRNTYWLNVPALKVPLDLWIFQEIISATKPDIIIECGTAYGGSALFMASICDFIKNGKVISIDLEYKGDLPKHKRIQYLLGSSTSPKILKKVSVSIKKNDKVMVILDSDHNKKHVLKELQLYHKFVTKDCYLIVEDTHLNGHPIKVDSKTVDGGPMEALEEFLKQNKNFVIDEEREKYLLTYFPKGYLKRIS